MRTFSPTPSSRSALVGDAVRILLILAAIAVALTGCASRAGAQYFGRNKVQYEHFKFEILRTPHFDVHYYAAEKPAAEDAARMLERWNTRFSDLFNHPLSARKPIILYADQPDFQQTNVVSEQLDEGTGGVTESMLDRMVLPLTGSYAESDHVLGHEMVHVFQYDIAQSKASVGASLDRLPQWLVEGMAEYLSLGGEDSHTAMWLRDAVLRNDLPTIKQLTNGGKYFPYRYGEALWAYIGGTWGDETVPRLFRAALSSGFDNAIQSTLGMSDGFALGSVARGDPQAIRAARAGAVASRGDGRSDHPWIRRVRRLQHCPGREPRWTAGRVLLVPRSDGDQPVSRRCRDGQGEVEDRGARRPLQVRRAELPLFGRHMVA